MNEQKNEKKIKEQNSSRKKPGEGREHARPQKVNPEEIREEAQPEEVRIDVVQEKHEAEMEDGSRNHGEQEPKKKRWSESAQVKDEDERVRRLGHKRTSSSKQRSQQRNSHSGQHERDASSKSNQRQFFSDGRRRQDSASKQRKASGSVPNVSAGPVKDVVVSISDNGPAQ